MPIKKILKLYSYQIKKIKKPYDHTYMPIKKEVLALYSHPMKK